MDEFDIVLKGPSVSEADMWRQVWIAVAASSNCEKITAPAMWADQFIEDYKGRFGDADAPAK